MRYSYKSKSTICSGFCFFSHSLFSFPAFHSIHSEPLFSHSFHFQFQSQLLIFFHYYFSFSFLFSSSSLSISLEELLRNILRSDPPPYYSSHFPICCGHFQGLIRIILLWMRQKICVFGATFGCAKIDSRCVKLILTCLDAFQ